MNYKLLHKEVSEKTELWQKAKQFCLDNEFDEPYSKILIVAHEFGLVRGVIGLDVTIDIEPLISTHPVITKNLYELALSETKKRYRVDRIEARVNNYRVGFMKPLLEKLGFKLTSVSNRFVKLLK